MGAQAAAALGVAEQPDVTADAGLGSDCGGCDAVRVCLYSRLIVDRSCHAPSQYGRLPPSTAPDAHGAAEADNSPSRFSPRSLCLLSRPVGENSRAIDDPVPQIYASLVDSFLRMILFLHCVSFACIVSTTSAVCDLRCHSAFKWPNRKLSRERRISVCAVFAVFMFTAPLCANGQVHIPQTCT